MYGGYVSTGGKTLSELWSLDIKNANWSSKTPEVPGIVWEKIATINEM